MNRQVKNYYVFINCDNGALWFPSSEELEEVIGFDEDGQRFILTRLNLSLEEVEVVVEDRQAFINEINDMLNKQYKKYIDEVLIKDDYEMYEEMKTYYYGIEVNSIVIRDYDWVDVIVVL